MKLYVGNLPYAVDDARLRSHFEQFGAVASAVVVSDRSSGRSKGFGFVEMDDADARTAMEKLNKSELEGRTIWVNEAKPRS